MLFNTEISPLYRTYDAFDFGRVTIPGGTIMMEIVLLNQWHRDIILSPRSFPESQNISLDLVEDITLTPGESIIVTAEVTPQIPGKHVEAFIIKTNVPDTPYLNLPVRYDVVAGDSDITRPETELFAPETVAVIPNLESVELSWSTEDTDVAFVELYYRRGNGSFHFAGQYEETSFDFNILSYGGYGIYEFYTIGVDESGNRELPPLEADIRVNISPIDPLRDSLIVY